MFWYITQSSEAPAKKQTNQTRTKQNKNKPQHHLFKAEKNIHDFSALLDTISK
jgi:hypothetical protein